MYRRQFSLLKKKGGTREDSLDLAGLNDFSRADSSAYTENVDPAPTEGPSPGSFPQHGTKEQQLSVGTSQTINGSRGDPLGLKVIHRPDGERRVDIIFIHGLGGSSRLTWSKNRDLNLFWPLRFLPYEPGVNEARILSYGYNSDFRSGNSKTKVSILDFAKDLLYDMKYGQDDTGPEIEDLRMGEKPIIFVVHSMGGLLIKEAYMQGQNDPLYQGIINSISAIIFLSTPHRGTHLAETLNRILQVSFLTSPMQFIAELAAGSQTLQRLNEQFRHVAPRLRIVSFYETRPTPMIKKASIMVIEKDSSVLGYPGEISKPLDTDHHGVCKYDSTGDPKYIAIRNVLKSLITEAGPRGKTNQFVAGVHIDPDKESSSSTDFAEFLAVPDMPDKDYNFFRDRWMPGTCAWIIGNEGFNLWATDKYRKTRLLWVHGNAASGKSILSSFIVDHLVQLGLTCSYFFVRFNDGKKRSPSVILRTLAYQLALQIPEYAERLRHIEAATTDVKAAHFRTVWRWLFLQALLQTVREEPVYLVIDGLDEAEQAGEIVRLFADLQTTSLPLRVLVVSRKTHEISSAWLKLGRQLHTDSVRTEGSRDDFHRYIEQEMDVAGDPEYNDIVTKKLLERSRGNFLWIHLTVQKINNCHTIAEVEEALIDLPAGMESLYDRMAASVETRSNNDTQAIGRRILGWATCTQRSLSIEELSDALSDEGLIEIHRTIGDLCGGFVIVDVEGRVTMIHETAREYLTRRGSSSRRPLETDRKTTHHVILQRCLQRLMDPAIRSLLARNKPPALLDYSARFWFIHLSHCDLYDPQILYIAVKFLKSPHVLTWINIAARSGELRTLVTASRYFTDILDALKLGRTESGKSLESLQALSTVEGWATDLVKIVGKFGDTLLDYPDSILKLIPPFCPESSTIYQLFGRKEARTISIGGSYNMIWDDCLARFSMDEGVVASAVVTGGSRIAILGAHGKQSYVLIYHALTFEKQRRIVHPERVLGIQMNDAGNILVSYGYLTTRMWDVTTGDCLKVVKNPGRGLRPHTMRFADEDRTYLVGCEDRHIRSFGVDDCGGGTYQWETKAVIEEQSLENTILNFPMCSALSPDGTMIAFGYRAYPLTVWELEPPMLVGQCSLELDSTDMTIQDNTFGEVFRVIWHPFSDEREVFGLTQVGLLFKWSPYEDCPSATAQTAAHNLAISGDGMLIATGDAVGAIKIFATADLSLLYHLSSQGPVMGISFSVDGKRLYDVRGGYGTVWQPDILVRLADISEHPDHNSDSNSEIESMAKSSYQTEHQSLRVDSVIALAGQSVGPLYCYGTEDGVAMLGEAGLGKICEIERLASFMSIEQVAWSDDGRLIAIADLTGKLHLKKVTRAGQNRDTVEVHSDFSIQLPPEEGHITQLFFHHTRPILFASTPTTLFSVDLDTQELKQSTLRLGLRVHWVGHPTLPDYILGFGEAEMQVVDCSSLRHLGNETRTYFPPRPGKGRSTLAPPTESPHRRESGIKQDSNTLGRLVVTDLDSTHILLQLWDSNMEAQVSSDYLIFDVTELGKVCTVDTDGDEKHKTGGVKKLQYSLVPVEIASRIREPLAFLSRRRLVFLDRDRWICTWRLPPTIPKRPTLARTKSDNSAASIEKHYFLPGDWVTADAARLYAVMPDGTLLCPRNGEVATVQYAKLRK